MSRAVVRWTRWTRSLTAGLVAGLAIVPAVGAANEPADSPPSMIAYNESVVQYQLLYAVRQYEKAAEAAEQALAEAQTLFGAEAPQTAQVLNDLGYLRFLLRDFERARPLYERALAIRDRVFNGDGAEVVQSLRSLARLYQVTGRCDEAYPLARRSLSLVEKNLSPPNWIFSDAFGEHAAFLRACGRMAEAAEHERRMPRRP